MSRFLIGYSANNSTYRNHKSVKMTFPSAHLLKATFFQKNIDPSHESFCPAGVRRVEKKKTRHLLKTYFMGE